MTATERLELLLTEARKWPLQEWRPRMSAAGDCRKALVYDAMEARDGTRPALIEKPVRWNAASTAGTAIGEFLEAAAKRLGAQTQVPVRIERDGVVVTGSADIVWPDAVWDLKWMGDYAYWQAESEPSESHKIQVAGYAGALGKPKFAVICWPFKSLGKGERLEIIPHEKPTPPDAVDRVVSVWREVLDHVVAGTLPERGFQQTKCKAIKCRFEGRCWS